MKATLEFSLPEEGKYLYKYLNGPKLYSMLMDLDQTWRQISKHGDNEQDIDRATWARDFLLEVLEAEGINLYE